MTTQFLENLGVLQRFGRGEGLEINFYKHRPSEKKNDAMLWADGNVNAIRQGQVGMSWQGVQGRRSALAFSIRIFHESLSQAPRKWVNPRDELSGENALVRAYYKVINLLDKVIVQCRTIPAVNSHSCGQEWIFPIIY